MKLQEAITLWDDLEQIWVCDDDGTELDPMTEIVLPTNESEDKRYYVEL